MYFLNFLFCYYISIEFIFDQYRASDNLKKVILLIFSIQSSRNYVHQSFDLIDFNKKFVEQKIHPIKPFHYLVQRKCVLHTVSVNNTNSSITANKYYEVKSGSY